MTENDLSDLLLKRLVAASGRPRGDWRRIVGQVRIFDRTSYPHCNWDVYPVGSPVDTRLVNRVVDDVRASHPIVID